MVPEYRATDGLRTKLGDSLVRRLPVAYRTRWGWSVAMMGVGRSRNCYVRHVFFQQGPYGFRIGKLMFGRKPWGMSRRYASLFGFYFGRA